VINHHSFIICSPAVTYRRKKKVCEDSLIYVYCHFGWDVVLPSFSSNYVVLTVSKFFKISFYSSWKISEYILQHRGLNSNIDAFWLKIERQVNYFIKITLILCNCITLLASYCLHNYSIVLVDQNIFIYISVYILNLLVAIFSVLQFPPVNS